MHTHESSEHTAHEHHPKSHHHTDAGSMAVSATLHCITGCSIGEITGLVIGTIIGLSTGANIALAVGLSFLFGYGLSLVPLLKYGLSFKKALSIILVADTLSILTMEIVDNIVMLLIPNAMNAGLVNPLYWIAMPISLIAAFFAAVPVNKYLLERGQGHALVHEYHNQ